MIHIEHVAIWARDLEALSSFYAQNFGASIGPSAKGATRWPRTYTWTPTLPVHANTGCRAGALR